VTFSVQTLEIKKPIKWLLLDKIILGHKISSVFATAVAGMYSDIHYL